MPRRAEIGEHRREVDLAVGDGSSATSTPRASSACRRFGVVDRRVEQHRAGRCDDARFGRRLEARVDDHAQRLARGLDQAHVEPRIVVAHGADAGQHRAGALAPGVAVARAPPRR